MQEKAATSSVGILGCWARCTLAAAAAPLEPCWLEGGRARPRGQTRLPKFGFVACSSETTRMPGNRRNQRRFLYAVHARISWSRYVVGYFDHTGAREGYQGQWGRWTDMADTQTDSKNQHCHRSDPLSPLKRLSVHLVAISSSPPQNAPHSSRRWCIKPLCPLFPLYV